MIFSTVSLPAGRYPLQLQPAFLSRSANRATTHTRGAITSIAGLSNTGASIQRRRGCHRACIAYHALVYWRRWAVAPGIWRQDDGRRLLATASATALGPPPAEPDPGSLATSIPCTAVADHPTLATHARRHRARIEGVISSSWKAQDPTKTRKALSSLSGSNAVAAAEPRASHTRDRDPRHRPAAAGHKARRRRVTDQRSLGREHFAVKKTHPV